MAIKKRYGYKKKNAENDLGCNMLWSVRRIEIEIGRSKI